MSATPTITRLNTHRCTTTHRTERAFLKCWARNINEISGMGPVAVVSWCSHHATLHADLSTATERLTALAADGCGSNRCHGLHRLYVIELAPRTPTGVIGG